MTEHDFRTDSVPFEAVWRGLKRAEFRNLSDRPTVKVGDMLVLREIHHGPIDTGRIIRAIVTNITTGYGIPDGYAMISFHRPLRMADDKPQGI